MVTPVPDSNDTSRLDLGFLVFWGRGRVGRVPRGTVADILSQGNPFLEENKMIGNI